jgi:hypothetical protein
MRCTTKLTVGGRFMISAFHTSREKHASKASRVYLKRTMTSTARFNALSHVNGRVSRSGIAVFDALVSCKLMSRKPLYISTGRGVTDPLTGLYFP